MTRNAWIAVALVTITLTVVAVWVAGRGREERDALSEPEDTLLGVSQQVSVRVPDIAGPLSAPPSPDLFEELEAEDILGGAE